MKSGGGECRVQVVIDQYDPDNSGFMCVSEPPQFSVKTHSKNNQLEQVDCYYSNYY